MQDDGDFVHVTFAALYTGHVLGRPALIGQLSEASENVASLIIRRMEKIPKYNKICYNV